MSSEVRTPFFVIWIMICLAGCNMDQKGSQSSDPSSDESEVSELKYGKIIVDNLRMRTKAGLEGSEMTLIGQNQFVRLTGNRSDTTESIAIRGKTQPFYWHEIIFNGDTGWVYGGGLEILDSSASAVVNDFKIIPGMRAGLVTKDADHESLIQAFGPKLVINEDLKIGEGETVRGTIIYPNTNNELKIFWQNEDFTNISQIVISQPGGEWQTINGIHIGQPIEEITSLNGNPFNMTGFQWDRSGTTLNWQSGKLDPSLTLSFDYQGDISIYPFLIGDKVISSDNSSLLKLKPRVREIQITINQ